MAVLVSGSKTGDLNGKFEYYNINFLIITDGKMNEVESFIREFNPISTFHQRKTQCSDLLLLSDCDFLICSRSTYSLWAAFFSKSPYLFLSPGLRQNEFGYYFSEPPMIKSKTSFQTRGFVVNPFEKLPKLLIDELSTRLSLKQNNDMDILRGGYASVNKAK